MGRSGRTRLTVEIEQFDDHLTGWLAGPKGEKHHFDGWLEFASAVSAFTEPQSEEGHSST